MSSVELDSIIPGLGRSMLHHRKDNKTVPTTPSTPSPPSVGHSVEPRDLPILGYGDQIPANQMNAQMGQSIPHISTPLRNTILALRQSPTASSGLRESSQGAETAHGFQWQQNSRGSEPARTGQKRKLFDDDPFVTKRPCTGQDSIDNTSRQSLQFPASHKQPPRGPREWQANSHAHQMNHPTDRLDASAPSRRHTVFADVQSAVTSRIDDRSATSSDLINAPKHVAGQDPRATVTRIKGEASAETSGSASEDNRSVDHANTMQSTDATSESRFEEALMRQFRQLDGQPPESQINLLKSIVRYEKTQVWQAKETQHLLESQRDSASARFQESLLKQELAESAKLKAENDLYTAESSKNKAEREMAEATYTARAATLESERMSKRLEVVSNEKIALLAEKDSWKAGAGQAAELKEKDDMLDKQRAKLKTRKEKIQTLKNKLATATVSTSSASLVELTRMQHLVKTQVTDIEKKQQVINSMRDKLSRVEAPTAVPGSVADFNRTADRLRGALAAIERLTERLADAERIVQSTHGPEVFAELKVISEKHAKTLWNKDQRIKNLNIGLKRARAPDLRERNTVDENENTIKAQNTEIMDLKRKLDEVTASNASVKTTADISHERSKLLEKQKLELERRAEEIKDLRFELDQAIQSAATSSAHANKYETLLGTAKEDLASAEKLLETAKYERTRPNENGNASDDEVARLKILLQQEKKSRKAVERKLAKEVETNAGLQVQVRRLQRSKHASETLPKSSADTSSESDSHNPAGTSSDESDEADEEGTATVELPNQTAGITTSKIAEVQAPATTRSGPRKGDAHHMEAAKQARKKAKKVRRKQQQQDRRNQQQRDRNNQPQRGRKNQRRQDQQEKARIARRGEPVWL